MLMDAAPIDRRHGGGGVRRGAVDLHWKMADVGAGPLVAGGWLLPPQETASAAATPKMARPCQWHRQCEPVLGSGLPKPAAERVRIDSCQSLRSRRLPSVQGRATRVHSRGHWCAMPPPHLRHARMVRC